MWHLSEKENLLARLRKSTPKTAHQSAGVWVRLTFTLRKKTVPPPSPHTHTYTLSHTQTSTAASHTISCTKQITHQKDTRLYSRITTRYYHKQFIFFITFHCISKINHMQPDSGPIKSLQIIQQIKQSRNTQTTIIAIADMQTSFNKTRMKTFGLIAK